MVKNGYLRILLNNKKERTADTWSNMGELQYIQKDTKEYILALTYIHNQI